MDLVGLQDQEARRSTGRRCPGGHIGWTLCQEIAAGCLPRHWMLLRLGELELFLAELLFCLPI